MRLVNWRSVAIGAAGFGLAACGDNVSVVTPQSALTVNPSSLTCAAGTSQALGATLTPSVAGATFTYTAGSSAVTVTGNGATATVNCVTAGTSSITIVSNGQTVTVPVTITAAQTPVTGILIAPASASIGIGGTVTVNATVLGTGTLPAARYRSAQPAIATVDSISGVVRGVTAGVATIIASPAGNPGIAAASTITVLGSGQLVQSIVPSPTSIALQTGQTATVAAQVTLQPNAPANTARTVTFSSGNNAVATVSSTGVVTAVANGATTITIRSTADTTFTAAVPVVVRDQAPVRISIQSITTPNTNIAIDLTAPVGTGANSQNFTNAIVATLNFDPGDARVSRIEVTLGDSTNVVCRQTFSAALADAFRQAATTGAADVQPIVCPINLAAFDTTTGRALVANGTRALRARVFGTFGTGTGATATQQIAQFDQPLQILNVSGFVVRVANTPSAAQVANGGPASGLALDQNGRLFRAGTVRVTVLPVFFDANTNVNAPADSVTISLVDPNFTDTGNRVRQLLVPATGGAITATFAGTSANALPAFSDNLNGFTSQTTGTRVQITGFIRGTASGDINLNSRLSANGSRAAGDTSIFIDNQNPQPAVSFAFQDPNIVGAAAAGQNFAVTGLNTRAGFVNRTFSFAGNIQPVFRPIGGLQANDAGLTVGGGAPLANPDFNGVDRVTLDFFAGDRSTLLAASAQGTADTLVAINGTRVSTGGDLAATDATGQPTALGLAVRQRDALGNTRNQLVSEGPVTLNAAGTTVTNAGGNFSFGLDFVAPTIQQTTGSGADSVSKTAVTIGFAGSDNIGFDSLPYRVVIRRQVRLNLATNVFDDTLGAIVLECTGTPSVANGLLAGTPTNAAFSTANSCTTTRALRTGTITLPGDTPGLGGTPAGQYTVDIFVRDQGGNVSPTITRRVVIDADAPFVGGVSIPQSITPGGTAIFSTAAADNLELGRAFGQIGYGNQLTIAYTNSIAQLGTAFDNVFTNRSSSIPVQVTRFIRSITTVNIADGSVAAGLPTLANSITAVVEDIPGNQGSRSALIDVANIAGGVNAAASTTLFRTGVNTSQVNAFTFLVTPTGGTASRTASISLSGSGGLAASATFTAQLTGAVNEFISPFQRVEIFYSQVGGPAIYQPISTGVFAGSGEVRDVLTGTTDGSGFTLVNGPLRVNRITAPFSPAGTTLAQAVASAGGAGVTFNIIAVAVTANGDALVSQPVQVTVNP